MFYLSSCGNFYHHSESGALVWGCGVALSLGWYIEVRLCYIVGWGSIIRPKMEGTCMGCWAEAQELVNDGFGNYLCPKCRGR